MDKIEKAALKPLPAIEFDIREWKNAKLHPDCYLQIESVCYSAPHVHRGRMLRVKLTEHHVEIFLEVERLAVHPRCRHKDGRRIKIDLHFPPASQACDEATPQKLVSQARFIRPQLHQLVVDLFNVDVYVNIRSVQGLIRAAAKELQIPGSEPASMLIEAAIAQMRHFEKIRARTSKAYWLSPVNRGQVLPTHPGRSCACRAIATGDLAAHLTLGASAIVAKDSYRAGSSWREEGERIGGEKVPMRKRSRAPAESLRPCWRIYFVYLLTEDIHAMKTAKVFKHGNQSGRAPTQGIPVRG